MRHAPLLPPYIPSAFSTAASAAVCLCIFLILYCTTGGFDSGSSNGTPSYTDEFCRFSEQQQQQHSLLVAESKKKGTEKTLMYRVSSLCHSGNGSSARIFQPGDDY